jgi:hypothetical protein
MNYYLNPKVQTTDREIYSFTDAIAQIGGLAGAVITVIGFFIKDIQKFLFHSEVAENTFSMSGGRQSRFFK